MTRMKPPSAPAEDLPFCICCSRRHSSYVLAISPSFKIINAFLFTLSLLPQNKSPGCFVFL